MTFQKWVPNMGSVILGIFMVLFAFTSFSAEMDQSATASHARRYKNSLFKMTENGLFSVEMLIPDKELKVGVNTLDIIIHDKNNKDVVGAVVTVTPWMPEMKHGVFEKPVVKEKGGGTYTVEDIVLIMQGHWELRINIRKKETEDMVIFDFPDVKTIGRSPFL